MRILMLSWEYPPHVVGGLGKHVMELAPMLAEQGVEVHIVTPMLRGAATDEIGRGGVHIHRVPLSHVADDGSVPFVQQANQMIALAAHQLHSEIYPFDLVHVHDWLMAEAGKSLKYAWRRPLIATIHATERGRQQGHIGNGHAEQVDAIEWSLSYESWRLITCSRFMADQVHRYFQTPLDKIDVVPNGVMIHPDPFTADDQRAFRRQFATDDDPLLFYVGRIVYEKGLHVLLDAWRRVRSTSPQARLLIAGTGAYLETLRTRAGEYGFNGDVRFAGFLSDEDRDRLYRVADAAVFPSIYEPFGIVALEAMAARCPVIVSDTGGLSEVVRHGWTGLRVAPHDPEALAEGILETLSRPEEAHQRAEAAFFDVRDSFNWARIASATAEVYTRTIADWEASAWGRELLTYAAA